MRAQAVRVEAGHAHLRNLDRVEVCVHDSSLVNKDRLDLLADFIWRHRIVLDVENDGVKELLWMAIITEIDLLESLQSVVYNLDLE